MCRWRADPKGGQSAQGLGRSRGGFTSKIHILVDALGNPLRFILTGGQVHDSSLASALLGEYTAEHIIGDKAYDDLAFIRLVEATGAIAVIPPRKNRRQSRVYDKHLYKERHLVECFINKLKYYRRVFARYDKLAEHFLGFIYFASTLIWLR